MSMSKQFPSGAPASLRAVRRHLACILAFLLLLAISSAPPALSQQPATTNAAARNAALVAATEEVLKETSDLRQLSIVRPVQSSTQSRAEIERAVIKNLDEDVSAADMHAAEVTLKKLGLAPADFQYRALMIRLLTEQVAGYYEPKSRQFHLADWIDAEDQKPVMAHELTHALQDQHFDLRRFEHWPKGDSDAELAAHALIEGDATLAMFLYVSSNPVRALTFLKSLGSMGVETKELEQAPRIVRESLLFPYQEGLNWTRALHKEGGWPAVSQAFTTLPQSTEQIIHPEKYLIHEAPVKITLADLTGVLNQSTRNSAGSKILTTWKRIASDVNGEWGSYLLLDQFLKSPAESRRAAAGWAGDRYAVYESSQGQVVFVSATTWDSEKEAAEFFDAYCNRTALRYPQAKGGQTSDFPRRPFGTGMWKTDEGRVRIELSGARVLIIEGAPDKLDLETTLAQLIK